MAAQKTGTRIAVIEIDHYRCIGCTVCVQSCTNDVLRMKAGKACIAYQEDCSACFSCEIDCPRDAVYLGLISGAY